MRTFIKTSGKAGNYPLKKADAAALERDVQRLLWNENIVLRTRQRQQLDKKAIRKARTVRELGVKANYLIALHTAEASSPVERWEWNHELLLQLMQQAVGLFWFE